MKNICRPFTLYCDFLPPSNGSRMWEYLSFGYYDGVDIGNNLFIESKWDLQKLWEDVSRKKEKLSGSYTEKNIYGFRTEDDDEGWENEFWEKREEYPFLFLVLLQNQVKGHNLIELWKERKVIEKEISDGDVKAVSYLTLDNSDLLLVLKCKKYSAGAEMIDSFHTDASVLTQNGWRLGYSYSIPSIRKSILNDSTKLENMQEIIESAYIHVISKYPGSTERIYNQLYEKIINLKKFSSNDIEKKGILGCNDDVIILKNIPWNIFLGFYQDEQGLLNHSSKEYREGITGVTTIIGMHENERKYKNESIEREYNTFCARLREKCRKKLKHDLDNNIGAIRDKLLLLLNSLEKYENSLFSDYTYISALTPINILIEMVEEASTRSESTRYDEFYQFTSCFNMYAQTTVRSDRQFTETPGFNVQMYETPVKINALYNAVIFDLKKALNYKEDEDDELPEYEFLICPGMVSNMSVREIYADRIPNKRLFLVDIPEKQAYNPQLILTMISHEVSHVVGRNMRLRNKERFECIAQMLASVFVQYIYYKVAQRIKGKDDCDIRDISWDDLYDATYNGLYEKIEWERINYDKTNRFSMDSFKIKEKEEWKEVIENYLYHTRMLRLIMEEYIHEIILNQSYFSDILGDKPLGNYIREEMGKLIQYSKWNQNETNILSIIDEIMYLFKECFADIGAILLLNLSEKEYLAALTYATQAQASSIGHLTKVNRDTVRAAIVCECMFGETDDYKAVWQRETLFNLSMGEEELRLLSDVVVRFIKNTMYESKEDIKEHKKEENVLYNVQSLEYLIDYLWECRKKFVVKEDGKVDMSSVIHARERLREVPNIFKNEKVEKVIFGIQCYIDSYREMLRQEIHEK